MKLLSGMSSPTSGAVQIGGLDPYDNKETQGKVCFIQENHPLKPNWKVNDALSIAADFYPNWDQAVAEKALSSFRLKNTMKISSLSKGMKTGIQIAIGLASRSPVSIFDEPTNGLDAEMRNVFYDLLLEEFEASPRIFLISTHWIEEIDTLLEEITVLHEGKIVFSTKLEDLRGTLFTLRGTKEQLEACIREHALTVLEQEDKGSYSNAKVKTEKQGIDFGSVAAESLPLQDYLLLLTKREGGRSHEVFARN